MPGGEIRVGCSGWQYKSWRGDFYPEKAKIADLFEHYARAFDTVELNNPFYKLPDRATAESWKRAAPSGFVYAWKASRFLTHMKKLKDPDEPIARMLGVAGGLGRKLGPILYQLPPHWSLDVDRLDAFLAALPTRRRHAIEIREPSWYAEEVLARLRARGVALCLHDMPGSESPRVLTASFAYVRFHGTTGKYTGRYAKRALDGWADWLAGHVRAGLDVFAYFNNDNGGNAPWDALRLREAIAARV